MATAGSIRNCKISDNKAGEVAFHLSLVHILFMERETGLEPATNSLEGYDSTN